MEGCNGHSNSRSLERAISRKAMQAGSSAPCKTWLIGFFCGVCITCLFGVVALPPLRVIQIQSQSVSPPLRRAILWNFTFTQPADGAAGATDELPSAPEKMEQPKENENITEAARIMHLYNAWATLLNTDRDEVTKSSDGIFNKGSDVPRPPHLDDCRTNAERSTVFDSYGDNGTFPPWTLWKGSLGLEFLSQKDSEHADQHRQHPPWIVGSDEENYPLTRQVQRDIWTHQHPRNCSNPGLRFLVADWERLPGFGIGAQLAGMSGLLAIAIKEKRILVTNHYNRADHNGCKGASRSSWFCYFFPETSPDCRDRAFELMQSKASWVDGTVKVKENYTSKEIWLGRIPRVWGKPWKYLQPAKEINGKLIANHRKMDRRWWVAQATRYLMRFPTEYMCGLLNVARHSAFGLQAAKLVLSIQDDSPKVGTTRTKSDIERLVWSDHKPYIPRPLLSMHVRMGDRACEMVVVGFEEYMELAGNLRKRFPSLKNIWLSAEMQEVIDKTKHYPHWSFYFTSVARQGSNMTMAMYEASLGCETSTNYPCQFHVGRRSGFLHWSPGINLVLPHRRNEEHRREGNVRLSIGEQGPVLVSDSKAACVTDHLVAPLNRVVA